MKNFDDIMEQFNDVPECCKSCDVYQYGMSASYCNDCQVPVCFYFDDDDEIDWDEDDE